MAGRMRVELGRVGVSEFPPIDQFTADKDAPFRLMCPICGERWATYSAPDPCPNCEALVTFTVVNPPLRLVKG